MGKYKNNPKKPFEVAIPNKIRKRFAMHYTISSPVERMEAATTRLRKALALTKERAAKKKGSIWSRLPWIKNFMQYKTSEGKLK